MLVCTQLDQELHQEQDQELHSDQELDQELEQDLKYRRQSARIRNCAWIRSAAGGKYC